MALPLTTALLLIGRADLLTGGPALRGDDVITLARPAAPPTPSPATTVILRWNELGPVALTARTVNGDRIAHTRLEHGLLFDTLRPAAALQRLQQSIVDPRARVGTAPLFYATATPAPGGVDIQVYSPVEISPDDICLIRTSPKALRAASIDDLSWLSTALALHAEQAPSLNSHQCAWRKAFPGQELEYKYTLPPDAPIWDLATDTLHHVRHGALPGFTLKHRDEFQTWDYCNHLFDIHAPDAERGYVSFIPAAAGEAWRMKRKWFMRDAFARREQLTDLPAIDDLDTYVRDVLKVQAHGMPSFRRIRYDVNVESLATGSYYGIFYATATSWSCPTPSCANARSNTAAPAAPNHLQKQTSLPRSTSSQASPQPCSPVAASRPEERSIPSCHSCATRSTTARTPLSPNRH